MPMDVTIHNQHSGIEFTSPVCLCDGRIYKEHSVERMDDDAVMKVSFRFGLFDKLPGGILMCEVQKKGSRMSDHRSSTDITSAKAVEDTSKMMRLLVTWEIESSGRVDARISLIEHDNELVLNEAKLAQVYKEVNNIPAKVYSWTLKYDGIHKWVWLMHDNTVLEATVELIFEKGFELKITVTEGVKDKDVESAFWIDSERQVSFLIVIYSMLIYTISLTLQSAMNVTINNQCSNMKLTSPVYFTKNTMSHIQFPQQVDSNSMMKVRFRTGMDQDTFGGVLLYRLQWKDDESTSTQLLVIWGYDSYEFYSHVRLIEHESTLVWDKDKLKMLYDGYDGRYNIDLDTKGWSLDDNLKLKTKCENSHGGLEMNIIISEEKDISSSHGKSSWLDSKR
jgi:hypothetical protein